MPQSSPSQEGRGVKNVFRLYLTFVCFFYIIISVEPTAQVKFFLLCRRCAVKKTVACHPVRAEWRRVRGSHGKSFSGEAIHITSTILTVLGAIGSIASIVSLVLYLYDKKK